MKRRAKRENGWGGKRNTVLEKMGNWLGHWKKKKVTKTMQEKSKN